MSTLKRIMIFIILPILAVLSYPPQTLINSVQLILVAVILFALLGFALFKNRKFNLQGGGKALGWLVGGINGFLNGLFNNQSSVLTLMIMINGLNVVIRMMMFFSNAYRQGVYNIPYIITSLFGIALSFYLMLRLDKADVRVTLVT